MSMKSALHEHVERLSEEDAELLLASLRGHGVRGAADELVRRFDRARDGFWRDDYETDRDYEEAVRQGARDLLALLQPAELEFAAKNWNTARGEYASERGHLLAFVRTESVETVARFVDYLNNRLDSDEPLPSEFPHLYAS